MKIQEFPYILYRFDTAISNDFFQIKSNGKKIISNKEYLSTSKGSGGHIVGFLKYDPEKEKIEDSVLGYTTIKGALTAFHDTKHPDLIILDPWNLFELIWENKLTHCVNYTLEDTIEPNSETMKFAELGTLMEPPNTAEVDFIGNTKLGVKVFRNVSKYSEIKRILDAAYKEFYKHLVTFPTVGLNALIPEETY